MSAIPAEAVITNASGRPLVTVRRENGHLFSITVHTKDHGPASIAVEDIGPVVRILVPEIAELAETWLDDRAQDWGGEVTRYCGRQLADLLGGDS